MTSRCRHESWMDMPCSTSRDAPRIKQGPRSTKYEMRQHHPGAEKSTLENQGRFFFLPGRTRNPYRGVIRTRERAADSKTFER